MRTWTAIAVAATAAFVALLALLLRRDAITGTSDYDMGSGQMFDTIAGHYDVVNRLMSLGMDMHWRKFLVERLQLKPTDAVLDLATGTADVAILAAESLSSHAAAGVRPVIGVDPSAKMLEVGREKVQKLNLDGWVVLRQGDAQDLADLSDGSFDKVVISFGIRNVPDRPRALREMRRVLADRPGAAAAVMDFHAPEEGFLAGFARFFVRYVTPLLGYVVSGRADEYSHLQRSIFNFPSPARWEEMMREAGLEVFEHHELALGVVHLYVAAPMAIEAPKEET